MIECLKKKVKNHTARASTRRFRYGSNIKMERLKENGVRVAVQETFWRTIRIELLAASVAIQKPKLNNSKV